MKMELKKCKKCERELPKNLDFFFKNCGTKDGFTGRCKECIGKKFTDKLTKIPKEGYKFCIKCDRELKATNSYFPIDNLCKDGLRNVCRECGKDGHFMEDNYVPKRVWSEVENKRFVELYPHYTNAELQEIHYPNESIKELVDRAFRLGVVKSEETVNRINTMKSERYGINSPIYGIKRSEETKRKLSIARKGKAVGENNWWFGKNRSEDQKIFMSKLKKKLGYWKGDKNPRHIDPLNGERNGRWQGGITPINAKIRNSDEYFEWKIAVFKRDDYLCQCCGNKKNLEAHHIENFAEHENKRFDINNGLTMCIDCHNPIKQGSFHHTYGTRNNNLNQLQEFFIGNSWDIKTKVKVNQHIELPKKEVVKNG